MFTVAHVSDLHLGGHPRAADRARRVVAHLLAMDPRPDLLLVTGDVADHGLTSEYEDARSVLAAWPGPLLVGPGNHDVRGPFAEVLLARPASGPLDQAYAVGPWRFLMLDSSVPAPSGQRIDHGLLAEQTLAWLDEQLAADDAGTFVCLHHPPVDIGIAEADQVRLRGADALAAVLDRHPHVRATLVGHHHCACASQFAGRPVLVGGGVVSTVTLDAEDRPLIDHDAPPTMAFHLVTPEGRVVTHWRSL